MFVQYLSERQQSALLHYAQQMARADGSVADDEQEQLDVLREQVQPGVEAVDVPLDELAALFDDRMSRVAFLLEVVGMGYANDEFDPAESQLANNLVNALGVGDDVLVDIKSWVVRQLSLLREAQRLMGG